MGWLDRAIDRGVRKGVDQALAKAAAPGGAFDQAIGSGIEKFARENTRVVGDLKPEPFTWQIAFALIRGGGWKSIEAKKRANEILVEWPLIHGIKTPLRH